MNQFLALCLAILAGALSFTQTFAESDANDACVDSLNPDDADFQICKIQNPEQYIAVPSKFLAYQRSSAKTLKTKNFEPMIRKKAALVCKFEKFDDPFQYSVLETENQNVKNVKLKFPLGTRVSDGKKHYPWLYEFDGEVHDMQMKRIATRAETVAKVAATGGAGLLALSAAVPPAAIVTGPLGGAFGFVATVSEGLAKAMPTLGPILGKVMENNVDSVKDLKTAYGWKSRFIRGVGHFRPAERGEEKTKSETNHWVFTQLMCKKYKPKSFWQFLASLNPFRKRPGTMYYIPEVAISDNGDKRLFHSLTTPRDLPQRHKARHPVNVTPAH